MTLAEAKEIADNPSSFQPQQWRDALARLYARSQFAQHTERAQQRFERRVQNLRDYIGAIRLDT